MRWTFDSKRGGSAHLRADLELDECFQSSFLKLYLPLKRTGPRNFVLPKTAGIYRCPGNFALIDRQIFRNKPGRNFLPLQRVRQTRYRR